MTQKGNLKYLEQLRWAAKINRHKMTKAESKIWYEFLKNRPMNYKFTRQKPLDRFILDFYCSELLLVIEIDGGYHLKKQEQDSKRDKFLNCLNIKTIRFKNKEILNELEKVKNEIIKNIQERKASLSREVPKGRRVLNNK
ncbi:MAG: endonuclease domain-containing protein [Candidatus Shapirobacteria bacterium]